MYSLEETLKKLEKQMRKSQVIRDIIDAILYALNEDGTFYRLKVVDGDGYANKYDLVTDFTIQSGSTITGNNLEDVYTDTIVHVYAELTTSQGGGN